MTSFRDLDYNAALCAAVFLGFLLCFPFLLAGYAFERARDAFGRRRG